MNQRTVECRHKAVHCERAASLATTLEVRLTYTDLAEHWRKLAEQSNGWTNWLRSLQPTKAFSSSRRPLNFPRAPRGSDGT
jgi:hypothetical protein